MLSSVPAVGVRDLWRSLPMEIALIPIYLKGAAGGLNAKRSLNGTPPRQPGGAGRERKGAGMG